MRRLFIANVEEKRSGGNDGVFAGTSSSDVMAADVDDLDQIYIPLCFAHSV